MNINMKFFLIYALISRKYSSDSYLIYIHKRDFFDSLFGKSAAYNLLLMHLFKEAFNKAECVYHLAGLADIVPSIKNPEKYFGTIKIEIKAASTSDF